MKATNKKKLKKNKNKLEIVMYMYVLYKRHNLDDNEKIIGIYQDKNKVIKIMTELFEKNKNYCYYIMDYKLNELSDGKLIEYLCKDC